MQNIEEKFADLNNAIEERLQRFQAKIDQQDLLISQLIERQVPIKHENLFSGFSAYASVIRNYNTDDVLLFDSVFYNNGNHYSPDTGVFVCPVDGMYLFATTLCAPRSGGMFAHIRMSGVKMAGSFSQDYELSSNLVITSCNAGAEVSIVGGQNGDTLFGSEEHRYSTFSAVIIHV